LCTPRGALVNASRSLTYAWPDQPLSEEAVAATIRAGTERIGNELAAALAGRDAATPTAQRA
jgi:hypothetical protein